MSDRALFAAFQKVKAQVDDAVSLTREREARARAEEEKARAAKKTRVVKAAETRRAEAGTASISASAFSATGGFGAALADAAKSLATATGVKGRVEVVPTDTDYTVLIDYAHSPDGVENVLKAVRGFAKGRVVALFGCGGDRDRTKRPKMGRIAADLADFCIVTSDNPRTEEPKAIIDDILEGMKDSKTPMQVIVDRPAAIHWALEHAQKDDIIVLMGKGHETYQEVNHVKHHMDEREIVAEYFKN